MRAYLLSPWQSQGQAETQNVGEQLHGEKSSGPGEAGAKGTVSAAAEGIYIVAEFGGGVDNVQIRWVHQRRPRCRWCFPQSFAPESSTPVMPWLRPATKKINRGAEVHRLQKALWAWKFNQYLCIVCPLWHYVHTQIFTYITLTKAECSCCSLHWLLWTLLLSRITMTTIKWMFGSVAFSKRLFSSTVYFRVGIILNLLIHLHTFACFLSLSLI